LARLLGEFATQGFRRTRVPEGRSIQSDVGAKFKGVSWS
jgi:hypothetical protein